MQDELKEVVGTWAAMDSQADLRQKSAASVKQQELELLNKQVELEQKRLEQEKQLVQQRLEQEKQSLKLKFNKHMNMSRREKKSFIRSKTHWISLVTNFHRVNFLR